MECEQEDTEGEQEDAEGNPEDVEGGQEGDDDVHITDKGETSGSGLRSRMWDLGRPDFESCSCGLYGDPAEHRFCATTQEIEEWLLG